MRALTIGGLLLALGAAGACRRAAEAPPPAADAANNAPVQYPQGGHEASIGTYKIDAGGKTLTYHVEGALVRALVGKDLPRAFEFSGRQMIVKSTRPEEHWRVVWEHY